MPYAKIRKSILSAAFIMVCTAAAHAQSVSCKDPWITQAYRELYSRMPVGTAVTGDCDVTRYGNGHWSNYQDLKSKVAARNAVPARPIPPPSSTTQYVPLRTGPAPLPAATIAPSAAFMANNRTSGPVGGRLIGEDGSSLVSNSSGTMRSLQSVDKPRAPAGKYLVVPSGDLVDASGNTVRRAGAYSIVVKNGASMIGSNGKVPVSGTVVTP